MPDMKRIRKIAMISVSVFIGLATTAFASYYVYEHREEIPVIKEIFKEKTKDAPEDGTGTDGDAATTTDWTISIEDGNVVKTQQNGSTAILADKNDYDNISEFTQVVTSPDREHMCFIGETLAPWIMYVARTNGIGTTEVGMAMNCVWSHDSSMIAYNNHTTDVSPHNVLVYFLSTGESTNFTGHLSTESVMRVYQDPVWSDDDTTITSLYNSYDDQDNWAQTTGYSIIDILTGEVRDVASIADTSGWLDFEQEETGISLKYPPDWSVNETCWPDNTELCLEVTNDLYEWELHYDPFVTGGGFGFLFDGMSQSSSVRTRLSIDGYTAYLITSYHDGNTLATEMDNDTIPSDSELWGWSITFTDPNDLSTLGFGPGEMYDEIENNRWSITYRYKLLIPDEGAMDFSDIPLKDDPELNEAIMIMNAISESVDLPE
jgi:hypothetical protein